MKITEKEDTLRMAQLCHDLETYVTMKETALRNRVIAEQIIDYADMIMPYIRGKIEALELLGFNRPDVLRQATDEEIKEKDKKGDD